MVPMKTKRLTKKEISRIVNALLVWQTIAQDDKTEDKQFAFKTFNRYAQELIDKGIPVHQYRNYFTNQPH